MGGLLPLAAVVKGLEIEDLNAIVQYLTSQIIKLGVQIRTGHSLDVSLVEKIKPDVVILATGGIPKNPNIPGIDKKIVIKSADLHLKLKIYLRLFGPKTLRWLTKFWMPIGKRVVIIGGEIQGCEVAEFLVKRGRTVTIVDTADGLGKGMVELTRARLFKWFDKKKVNMIANVKYEEITANGLIISYDSGEKRLLEADTIITALPLMPNKGLFTAIQEKVPETYLIGDSREPGLIIDAIAEGFRISNSI